MKKNVICILTLLLILCFLASCGGDSGSSDNTPSRADEDQTLLDTINPTSDLDGDGITNENDTDIDGDGLSNSDEDQYGTSAYIEDTDGDGWTDYEEIERFVASQNIFNPVVADLPRIELILKSAPLVKMEYETTTGQSVEYSTATSNSYEQTHTTSNSFAHTFGTEHGWSVETGIDVGQEGEDVVWNWHLYLGAHGTYTTEDTWEWGTERSYTNARSAESAKSISSSEDLTKTGGSISYSVVFKNTGPIAYTVDTMELVAYKIDRNDPEIIGSISQSSNSSFSEFQSFQLNPGQESGEYIFRNDSLYVSDVMSLLEDSSGIICSVAGYSISMEDVSFTQSGTDVPAKTAKIFIDYGPTVDIASEQYSVATKTNINTNATTLFDLYNPVPLKDLLASINIPYELGYENPETGETNNGLVSVRNVKMNDEYQKYWYVAHKYREDNTDMLTLYAAHKSDYDFDEISVKTGDTIELIHSVDGDGDGIPVRVEKMLGTSDELVDSDGDTISDWDELHPDPETAPKTNPANKDTDGDGLLDNEDDDPLVAKISDDAVLVNLELSEGTINFVKDPEGDGGEKVRDYTVTGVVSDRIQITPYAAKSACPITITVNDDEPVDVKSDVESDAFPLEVGDNTIVINVTALDGVTEETYTLNIYSKLSPVTDVYAQSASDTVIQLGWAVPDDDRISGILIRRFHRRIPDIDNTEVLDNATPEARQYDVGQSIGNGDVVYVYPDSPPVEETDDELNDHTYYWYEIFTFNKLGSVYTYSDGTRVTSSTTRRTPAQLNFELYHLKAIEDKDPANESEYYWDIHFDPGGMSWNQKLDSHVQLSAEESDVDQYYSFFSDSTRSSAETRCDTGQVEVHRDDNMEVTLYIRIYEHDGGSYDRGTGEAWGQGDDLMLEASYPFKYDFDTDTFSCLGCGQGFPGEFAPGDRETMIITTTNESRGTAELKMGFWWEEYVPD